jgi:threonine dehydrogenase-like Zn-dependent dehydrogenase
VETWVRKLLPEVLRGTINPGRVFDRTVDLAGVPDGYQAMAERSALKVMIAP